MNYLEVNKTTGVVKNVIIWDGKSPYFRDGFDLVKCDDAPGVWIGWTKTSTGWEPPVIEEVSND